MGARQSKRSVDITTGKEVAVEGSEVAAGAGGEGKLERIEDLDTLKPQLNGDAHQDEQISEKEKKMQEQDERQENEKDNCTEKEIVLTPVTVNGSGEGESVEEKPVEQKVKEKKPKKENVKKKWSFRSLSFSKKDKQKPAKKEETNGECERVPEEGAETSPINEASEIKAENVSEKELSEKEPETPVTEPLTNGGSAPETPKEEIKQNGESAAVEESPVEVPVEEKVLEVSKTESTQEPVKEEDKPEEKANGLTVEEPTPVEVKAPLAEEPKVPEVIADEKVEAAGDSEVCSEKASPEAGCVEVVPPPLPSSPPPSSLTIFAESTMAPIVDTQNVDTSLPSLIPAVNSPAETVVEKQAIEPQNISSDEKPLEPSHVPSAHEDLCEPNPVENLSPAIQNVAVVSSEMLVSSSEPSSVIEPPNTSVENTDSIPPPSDLPEIVDSDKPLVEAEIPAVEQQIPVAESATVPDEPVIEQEIPIMKSTELESPIPVSDATISQEDSTENVPVAEKSVEQSAIPLEEHTVLIASQTESKPEVISENVESNKDELVENIASKESNLPSPIDDVPNVSNESPILQRTSSDLDVSETMPPSDSFPPPPPPESCPESMTETSASESLPPPMSEFSVPDAILNSPTSEMVELPGKEEVSVNGESLTETKEVQENGIHDPHTEVNGFTVDDSIVAGVAKVPGHPEESSIPQVKSVSEVVDVPPPTESTTTESVPSETTVAE